MERPRQTPTLHHPMNLTDDEIRIKVAEACGWYPVAYSQSPDHATAYKWKHPDGREGWGFSAAPNYPQDLNACAEFEQTLKGFQADLYADILTSLVEASLINGKRPENVGSPHLSWHGVFQIATATARQRCLAYLKTKGILP